MLDKYKFHETVLWNEAFETLDQISLTTALIHRQFNKSIFYLSLADDLDKHDIHVNKEDKNIM